MGFEIERKFLVRRDDWRQLVNDRISIRQAYLASSEKASIRVRIEEESAATLTVKSRPHQLRRLELEYTIPVLEAEALMQLRRGAVIEKTRHVVPCGDLSWEIDVFSGENAGLTIAEIELRHEPSTHRIAELDWRGSDRTAALLQQLVGGASVFFMAAPAGARNDRTAGIIRTCKIPDPSISNSLNRPGSLPSTARP
jgi:adenylate cyclase